MPALLLACVAYLGVALPGSTLGLLWPSIRLSFGQPVGALGILLVPGIAASVVSSAVTGRLRLSAGPLVAASTLLIALALAAEAIAPSMSVMIAGTVPIPNQITRIGTTATLGIELNPTSAG